jgi:hypothetical protein
MLHLIKMQHAETGILYYEYVAYSFGTQLPEKVVP